MKTSQSIESSETTSMKLVSDESAARSRSLTLRERTQEYSLPTFGGLKYSNEKIISAARSKGESPSGRVYRYCYCEELVCIDIDIKKKDSMGLEIPEIEIDDTINDIESKFECVSDITPIERTPSGGFHIYANIRGAFRASKCVNIKVFESDRYDIDIFPYVEPSMRSGESKAIVCFDESTVAPDEKKGKKGGKYRWMNSKGIDEVVMISFDEVMDTLGIDKEAIIKIIEEPPSSTSHHTSHEGSTSTQSKVSNIPIYTSPINETSFELLMKGFNSDMKLIHNDSNQKGLKDRLSLWGLISTANALPEPYRCKMIEAIKGGNLTSKARGSIDDALRRYENTRTPLDPIEQIRMVIARYNPSYFKSIEKQLKQLYDDEYSDDERSDADEVATYLDEEKESDNIHDNHEDSIKSTSKSTHEGDIDSDSHSRFLDLIESQPFPGDISFDDVVNRISRGKYSKLTDIIIDIAKVYRIIDLKGCGYVVGPHKELEVVKESEFESRCSKCIIKIGEKSTTLKNLIRTYYYSLTVSSIEFLTKEKRCISLWNGWKYSNFSILSDHEKEHIESIIQPFLDFISMEFSYNDEYINYFLKWIANMMQHPSIKNASCPILYGLQGTGKTTITNYLMKLFEGFSIEVDGFDSLTGRFNGFLENKVLVIVGEAATLEDGKMSRCDMNKLKKLVTDSTQEIERKGVDKVFVKSVCNIIVTTNHMHSIPIESEDDRRYAPIETNREYRNDDEYFKPLRDMMEDDRFITALTYYFMNLKLDGYVSTRIPLTDLRKHIIERKQLCDPFWVSLAKLYRGEDVVLLDEAKKARCGGYTVEGWNDKLFTIIEMDKRGSRVRPQRATKKDCIRMGVEYKKDLLIARLKEYEFERMGRVIDALKVKGEWIQEEFDMRSDDEDESIEGIKSSTCSDIKKEPTQRDIKRDLVITAIKARFDELKEGIPTSEFEVEGVSKRELNEFMRGWCKLDKQGFSRKRVDGRMKNCYILNDEGLKLQ